MQVDASYIYENKKKMERNTDFGKVMIYDIY